MRIITRFPWVDSRENKFLFAPRSLVWPYWNPQMAELKLLLTCMISPQHHHNMICLFTVSHKDDYSVILTAPTHPNQLTSNISFIWYIVLAQSHSVWFNLCMWARVKIITAHFPACLSCHFFQSDLTSAPLWIAVYILLLTQPMRRLIYTFIILQYIDVCLALPYVIRESVSQNYIPVFLEAFTMLVFCKLVFLSVLLLCDKWFLFFYFYCLYTLFN